MWVHHPCKTKRIREDHFTLMALFTWLIIRLIRLVFSVGIVFFSHKKSATSVFQPAYISSRTGPKNTASENKKRDCTTSILDLDYIGHHRTSRKEIREHEPLAEVKSACSMSATKRSQQQRLICFRFILWACLVWKKW
jgi:hypothetical protein